MGDDATGEWGNETGKRRRPIICAAEHPISVANWIPILPRLSENSVEHASELSHPTGGKLGVYPPALTHGWLRAALESINPQHLQPTCVLGQKALGQNHCSQMTPQACMDHRSQQDVGGAQCLCLWALRLESPASKSWFS